MAGPKSVFGKDGNQTQEEKATQQPIVAQETEKPESNQDDDKIVMSRKELNELFEEKLKIVSEKQVNPFHQLPPELLYPKSNTEILDETIDLLNFEPKDRIYRTFDGTMPITLSIASKSKKSRPLTWYNEATKKTHALRYATNHPSIFEDVQGNNNQMQIGSIVLNDGSLFVPKENITLQRFLKIHPDNGVLFVEHDPVKENQESMINELDVLEAKNRIAKLTASEQELVLRAIRKLSYDPDTRKNGALIKFLFEECNKAPKEVINLVDEKMTTFVGMAYYAVQNGIIKLENNKIYMSNNFIHAIEEDSKDVYYDLAKFIKKAEGQNIFNAVTSSMLKLS
jgi:hypothetical protein